MDMFQAVSGNLVSAPTIARWTAPIDMPLPTKPLKQRVLIYLLSALFVGIALVLRLSLSVAIEGSSAFLLFLAAVMASSCIGGTKPGLFATLLAALDGNYFFMEPRFSFGVGRINERVEFVLFLLEGTVITILAGMLHRARNAAIAGQTEARELEKRILEISDGEQRRIGHDLHDGLGQHLTGIALLTRRLEQRLAASESPDTNDASQISALAKTAVEWTQDLCRSLSPPILEKEGLAAALRELAHHAESLFHVRCALTEEGNGVFREIAASVHLYRIAQEAISNAVKHGRATDVQLRLSYGSAKLQMQVIDNGCGIAQTTLFHQAAEHNGMGLRIMHYRAKMIGATLTINQPRPSLGTVVACVYPLAGAHSSNGERSEGLS